MKKHLLLAFLVSSSAMSVELMAQDNELDLKEVLSLTQQNDQRIEAARYSVEVATEEVFDAKTYYLPRVRGVGNFSVNETLRTNFLGTQSVDGRNIYGGVEATQELFAFGRKDASLAEGRAGIREQQYRVDVQEDEVLLEATRAYLDFARANTLLNVQVRYAADMKDLLDRTKDKFDNQLIGRGEYLLVRSRYQQAEASVSTIESEVTQAFERLAKLIDTRQFRIKSDPMSLYVGLLPQTMTDAVEQGKAEDPRVKVAFEMAEGRRANVKLQKANKRPKVSLRASAYRGRIDGSPSGEKLVGLNVDMPLYSAGSNKSRIRKATSAESRARALLRDEISSSEERIVAAWRYFEVSKKTEQSWADALVAEVDAVAELREEVDNQLQSLMTLLESREQLVEVEVRAIRAKYDRLYAGYHLLTMMGRISQLIDP